jgi:DNA polymerase epsilon subunit 1
MVLCNPSWMYNECNEQELLERFFLEVRLAAPRFFVTYTGDYFDWPFVEKRTAKLGIINISQIGVETHAERIGKSAGTLCEMLLMFQAH